MATTAPKRSRLNECGVFRQLRRSVVQSKPTLQSKDILCIHDDYLFVWNAQNSTVLAANLNDDIDKPHQTLLLTNPPLGAVSSLSCNEATQSLAVWGPRGVTIVHLPRRWGRHSLLDGGKDTIVCRCVALGDGVLTPVGQVDVVSVRWVPGSPVYLCVLTSDNQLRIYNVMDGQQPAHVYLLGAASPFLRCLGDTAVAFDFGPTDLKNRDQQTVFVLRGNGDVYTVDVSLTSDRIPNLEKCVSGPLTMHPAAEDNYGVEACALLCLKSQPPLIVVATASGTLYHCLVLHRPTPEDDTKTELALYVIDSVELELSLTTCSVDTGQLEEDAFTCPIRLISDPVCPWRYHCSHAAGVHSVAVPFLPKLEDFLTRDTSTGHLPSFRDPECVVEHLVCTKPLNSSPVSPVVGACVLAAPQTSLVVLTSDFELVVIPLLALNLDGSPSLLESSDQFRDAGLRSESNETFTTHIRNILSRSATHPLLKSGSSSDLSPQDSLQLLDRAIQVLRSEYVQRFEVAHEELQCRMKSLKELNEQQVRELKYVEEKKTELTQNAEILAERHEDVSDKQTQLIDRVERALRAIQEKLPSMSDAERAMLKELETIKSTLATMNGSLDQIKMKRKHMEDKKVLGKNAQVNSPVLDDARRSQLQEVLKNQGKDLIKLKTNVSQLSYQLGLLM